MMLEGSCHCGNIRIEFETALAPAELPLRACQCTFCRAHGVVSTSDPQGELRVRVNDANDVQRYRFGLKITDYLICRRCGVYVLAMADMAGGRYAAINANSLDCRAELSQAPQPMDYEGESAEARRARRLKRWTPVGALHGL